MSELSSIPDHGLWVRIAQQLGWKLIPYKYDIYQVLNPDGIWVGNADDATLDVMQPIDYPFIPDWPRNTGAAVEDLLWRLVGCSLSYNGMDGWCIMDADEFEIIEANTPARAICLAFIKLA
jgi:hypothetical protein